MNTIDPDLFAKLMTLPEGIRLDLLEFLGATPVGEEQLNTLIGEIETMINQKRSARENNLN